MDKRFLEQINELLDSSERNFFSDISDIVRERFPDSNEKEIEEFKKYVDEFVECCTGYGSRIANDCKMWIFTEKHYTFQSETYIEL